MAKTDQEYTYQVPVRRFVPWARRAALALIITSLAVACIYGVDPLVRVSFTLRSFILLVWYCNLCTFCVTGGMVLWGWLADRYGDKRE